MTFYLEEEKYDVVTGNLNKKPEIRKEMTVAFQTNLRKIEEVEEISKSLENRERRTKGKNERPKSAGFLPQRGLERGVRKRPKSTEIFLGDVRNRDSEMKKRWKQVFEVRETSCRGGVRCECASVLDVESRCSSFCGCRARACSCDPETNWWTSYNHCNIESRQRRCRSNPNFLKTISEKEKDLHKIKRSLRLIGLELSDFGVYSSMGTEAIPRPARKWKSSPSSTKVIRRTVSLESLRHAVKRAWLDDRLDESHRKLLSQAAYEEWYFKKEKELRQKQDEKKQRKAEAKENIRKDFEEKKAKAEEEFRKWMQRKKIKRKEKESLDKKSEDRFGRIGKTKEDTEAAFLKWKKEKDKEMQKKRRQKAEEEGKKMESERQKNEKKIIAEKAFQQWKTKLEESEKLEGKKRKIKSKKDELEIKKKQDKGSQISFQLWKEAKDEQFRQKLKQNRELAKLIREERQIKMEERIYEAEQAFEDWLEKIDIRKHKKFNYNFHKIPWIPA